MTLTAEQLSSAVSGLLMIMVAIDGNRIVTQVNVPKHVRYKQLSCWLIMHCYD
jgi:hypothetical protein